jgi:mannose-6-phosphate isomerase
LVGFKPFSDIQRTLEGYPELADFIGREIVSGLLVVSEPSSPPQRRDLVQSLISALLRRSTTCERELARAVAQLEDRLGESRDTLTEAERIFLGLRRRYPGPDVGLFSVFLMNLVQLEQGQGIFIEAGLPHAYLEGDIVECMTNSDNVVRAGLTPKFRDVEALVQILSYHTGLPSILAGQSDGSQTVYPALTPEFQVSRWHLEPGEGVSKLGAGRPEVWLIMSGHVRVTWGSRSSQSGLTGTYRETFNRGQSLLIPACLAEFSIGAESRAELFRVTVPLFTN